MIKNINFQLFYTDYSSKMTTAFLYAPFWESQKKILCLSYDFKIFPVGGQRTHNSSNSTAQNL
jgi:hypothetical protein